MSRQYDQTATSTSFWGRVNEAVAQQNPEAIRESCIFNMVTHGGVGFLFGGALGMFMSGMASSSPELHLMQQQAGGDGAAATSLPVRQQMRLVLKDMGQKTWSSAKSFGRIATIYSASECVIEGYRAKHDIWNTLFAGSVTGGLISIKSIDARILITLSSHFFCIDGPKAVVLGAAGFAAFSMAIDHFFQDRF